MTDGDAELWEETGEWIIVSKFRETGDPAYWGWRPWKDDEGLTPQRQRATRYTDKATAYESAYRLKELHAVSEYEIEPILRRKRHKGTEGSSGRA